MNGTSKTVILADWGNSSGRLYCVRGTEHAPEILDTKRVAGVKDTNDCAALFEKSTKDWIKDHAITEAIFCGAVTSNIGWTTTEYAPIPARVANIKTTKLTTPYGLTCTFLTGTSITAGPHGYFDTVRGEDMQAFGWMALTGLTQGTLCTPGTHTKWLSIDNGEITNILTGVTGESFEVLNKHSILTRGAKQARHDTPEFERGLKAMKREPRPALTHMLMAARTLQLSGELSQERSADYLSGLLTGEDCAAALGILPEGPIHIIGDGHAVDRYAQSLKYLGRKVETHDGQACVIAGLQSVRN